MSSTTSKELTDMSSVYCLNQIVRRDIKSLTHHRKNHYPTQLKQWASAALDDERIAMRKKKQQQHYTPCISVTGCLSPLMSATNRGRCYTQTKLREERQIIMSGNQSSALSVGVIN